MTRAVLAVAALVALGVGWPRLMRWYWRRAEQGMAVRVAEDIVAHGGGL